MIIGLRFKHLVQFGFICMLVGALGILVLIHQFQPSMKPPATTEQVATTADQAANSEVPQLSPSPEIRPNLH